MILFIISKSGSHWDTMVHYAMVTMDVTKPKGILIKHHFVSCKVM
jgi:hypothetical protein